MSNFSLAQEESQPVKDKILSEKSGGEIGRVRENEVSEIQSADVVIEDLAVSTEVQESVLQKFDIWEYRVQGATLLTNKEIERAVYPYLGPKKTYKDAELARDAIAQIYRSQGYALANVVLPQQSGAGGIVNIIVNEGKISRVRITGNQYFSRKDIREKVPSLVEGESPHLPSVRKELADINKGSRDRQVFPILREGQEEGTTEVELKVKDEAPLHGGISLNGRNSPSTSRTRLNAFLAYGNLWQKQHSVLLNYVTTPSDTDEVRAYGINYGFPVFGDARLSLYALEAESDVSVLGDVQVVGDGSILGARLLLPLQGAGGYSHSLVFEIQDKDFGQTSLLTTDSQLDVPIDYTSLQVGYSGNQRFDRSRLGFSLTSVMGLRGFGNSAGEFERKRAGSKNNFIYLEGKLNYAFEFENEWEARTRMEFQQTGDPLIGNEQYSAGGQRNVRGYLTSQELSDEAYFASAELWTPDFADYSEAEWLTTLQFFTFLDYAYLHNLDTLPGEDSTERLAGAGLGLRAGFLEAFLIDVSFARALSDSREGDDAVESGDHRTHFSVGASF